MKYKAKKLLSVLMSLIFSMSVLTPFSAGAEDIDNYNTGEVIYDYADGLPSDDELLAGYFENKLYESDLFSVSEAVSYSALGTSRLNSAELEIYNTAKAQIERIAAGEESSAIITVPSVTFTYEQLGISEDSSETEIKEAIAALEQVQ